MKPHKHAELIKAWADGAEIQVKNDDNDGWDDCWQNKPMWDEGYRYRIKPEPKPDVVLWASMHPRKSNIYYPSYFGGANLKLIWDGETGNLKSAEVLK